MSVIAAVLDRYGVYTAALEREYILSQQRKPGETLPVESIDSPSRRAMVATVLQSQPRWWSTVEVHAVTGLSREFVTQALSQLVYAGFVTRMHPPLKGAAIHRGASQRYRWVQARERGAR